MINKDQRLEFAIGEGGYRAVVPIRSISHLVVDDKGRASVCLNNGQTLGLADEGDRDRIASSLGVLI